MPYYWTAAHSHFDRNHQNICLMLRRTGLQLIVILTIHLGLVQGMSINILPSATNRSKPNNYLFYNRIPKCGSSTAMRYMRHLSFNLSYAWIGKKLTTILAHKKILDAKIDKSFYMFDSFLV